MKGTRHNGRSGKDGVYNPLHNDRRFDPEHSEHIDNERVRQNIYWDCYQGYTTMADRGKEDNFSFNQIEMAYYVDHYSDYVINQNKRHEKARHPDRCKGVEDVLKNKKTCPEESIYQLGTIDEHASVETLVLVFDEFKKEFDERFGSNVHVEQDFLTYVKSKGQDIVKQYCIQADSTTTFLSDKSEGKILIEGSTSMEPMVKALADDYQKQNPNAEIEVKATDSSRGITAVISGECDFAMSSRELKDYEAELLETKVIGKDAIAIVINEENPLENLTIKQLTGLYNGTYKNWDDLS